jgi:transcriptional regulator with XRE-family HTH domain
VALAKTRIIKETILSRNGIIDDVETPREGGGDKVVENEAALLKQLNQRRRALGLSYELLSKRSGVSRPTVQRVLSGRHAAASLANVVAIAEALGLALRFDSRIEAAKLRREQAERKARKLVALVQGTSGLEGQAVDRQAVETMVEQTTHELLAGSKSKLWSEE